MDKSISVAEKKKKVEATLTALGLQKVKNSYCGLPDGSIRGISGLFSNSMKSKSMIIFLKLLYWLNFDDINSIYTLT